MVPIALPPTATRDDLPPPDQTVAGTTCCTGLERGNEMSKRTQGAVSGLR